VAAMDDVGARFVEAWHRMERGEAADEKHVPRLPAAGHYVSSPTARRLSRRSRSSPPGVFGSSSITFCHAA
jgi:hypothetical protein